MRRLIAVPRSLIPHALATAAVALAATLALTGAPAAASAGSDAAPAPSKGGNSSVFTTLDGLPSSVANGKGSKLPVEASPKAVFTCYYYATLPPYVIDFQCNVTQGAIQLWVACNGVVYYDPAIMVAVGTYYSRANCYPYQITNFGAVQLA